VNCGFLDDRFLPGNEYHKYIVRFKQDVAQKKVYVVDDTDWNESFLGNWFMENFGKLDFQEIFVHRSKPYMDLKAKMNFYGFPDFLAKRKGKMLRVELECFSSQFKYMHQTDYCEVVLCYEIDEVISNMEVHELKRILGYENIINNSEIFDYMYIRYEDFRKEFDYKAMKLAMSSE
jgi:hypothetical protein